MQTKNFVLSCQKCNTRKNPVHPTKAPLQPLQPAATNERWAMDIERIYTSPYHPQTDGLLEKFHSTLGKNLSMYVTRDHQNWDLYTRAACYGYNTSVCIDSTQYSPFYLMFGRETFSPLDTVLPTITNQPRTVREYAL